MIEEGLHAVRPNANHHEGINHNADEMEEISTTLFEAMNPSIEYVHAELANQFVLIHQFVMEYIADPVKLIKAHDGFSNPYPFRSRTPKGKIAAIFLVVASLTGLGMVALNNTPSYVTSATVTAPDLPNNFQINERFLTIGDVFDIETESKPYGTVSQEVISLAKRFTYGDKEDNIIATARKKIISWGVEIEVFDHTGKLIGSIEEKVLESLFKVHTVYEILDANGIKVAESKKLEFFGTDITLYNLKGEQQAELKRPFWNWPTDKWSISVQSHNGIDERILVMLAAYKTSADNDRKAKESSETAKKSNDASSALKSAIAPNKAVAMILAKNPWLQEKYEMQTLLSELSVALKYLQSQFNIDENTAITSVNHALDQSSLMFLDTKQTLSDIIKNKATIQGHLGELLDVKAKRRTFKSA